MKNSGYYDAFIASPNPARQVGWRSELEQAVRFEIVSDLIRPDDSLLDLGCGTGALGRYLRRSGWKGRYIGVDAYPHARLELANSEFVEADFTLMEPVHADTVVSIGALVGNDGHTSLPGILQLLTRARRSFLIVGLSRNYLDSTYFDAALEGFEFSELPAYSEWELSQLQCLNSDTSVVGQRSRSVRFRTANQWLEQAKSKVEWTNEELAWVCAQLGLGDEVVRLHDENPHNESIQIAFERWQLWHKISLA